MQNTLLSPRNRPDRSNLTLYVAFVLSLIFILPGSPFFIGSARAASFDGYLLAAKIKIPPNAPLAPGQKDCSRKAITRVLGLVNLARKSNGLRPLRRQRQLEWAARTHTIDIARSGSFSHDGWTGYINASGFRGSATGENIAVGFLTAESVMNAWLSSPGHRANILSAYSRYIGIGCIKSGSVWWTQDFGR